MNKTLKILLLALLGVVVVQSIVTVAVFRRNTELAKRIDRVKSEASPLDLGKSIPRSWIRSINWMPPMSLQTSNDFASSILR
jgi:hypothetical protein